jgi:hypothetical protein
MLNFVYQILSNHKIIVTLNVLKSFFIRHHFYQSDLVFSKQLRFSGVLKVSKSFQKTYKGKFEMIMEPILTPKTLRFVLDVRDLFSI